MDRARSVLLIGADAGLRGEFEGAIAGLPGNKPLTRQTRDTRSGLAAARDWRPALVCLELPPSADELRIFAAELAAEVPEARLVLLRGEDDFHDGEAESAYLLAAVRCGVADVLRRPLSRGELRSVLGRLFAAPVEHGRARGRIVSFISNKGGVGKSTLSVSVACALAREMPGRVLLVDASVQLGVTAFMLGLEPEATLLDAVRERERLDETLLMQLAAEHPCGLRVLVAPSNPVEAAEIDEGSLARVLSLAGRTFDIVIVDTFPMLDGLVLSCIDLSELVYLVAQATVPGVVGIARLLATLQGLGCPVDSLRVIVNHSHPAHAGRLAATDIAERIGKAVDHVVPWQRRLLPALDSGRPYILRATRLFGFGRAVQRIADEIAAPAPARTTARNGSVRLDETAGTDGSTGALEPPESESADLHGRGK